MMGTTVKELVVLSYEAMKEWAEIMEACAKKWTVRNESDYTGVQYRFLYEDN